MSELDYHENKERLYSLLKTLLTTQPDFSFLKLLKQSQFLKMFKDLGISICASDIAEDCLENLKDDYQQLFIGPQKHIALNESIYREETPQFYGKAAQENTRILRELGLTLEEKWMLMPDHFTVEFEILQKLAQRESIAQAAGDQLTARRCQRHEKEYFLNHIVLWVPSVCDQVVKQAQTRFYREIALFIKDFVESKAQDYS